MNQIVKSAADALTIGETFFKSGMFSDIKSAQQAVVKIMAGAEMGISPFAAMSGIHIIQGKPTIGAGLMAARVKGFGKYDYRVLEHTDKVCSIEFGTKVPGSDIKSLGISTFTIEDAKKAGTKNIDRFPKNMLFARAMSNGVKWYTPDIYENPVYVPEEMEQVTEDTTAQVVETPSVKRVLTPEQFEKLCAGIEAGQMATGSELTLYEWAVENVELTDGQRLQLDVAHSPKENFVL
jgi:hypothetical protein